MGKQSNVEVGQRREAVLSLLRKEDTAAAIARRYQVSEPTLYRWRDEFLAGGEAALSKGRGKADGQQAEVRQFKQQLEERDQVIGELTVANRILKKLSGQSL
jgi:transposase-like protein